jgi:hypothetical protein
MSEFIPIPTSKRFQDLTGQRFSRLLIVGYLGRRHHSSLWRCICDCGNETDTLATSLKTGTTKSCGCWQRERMTRLTYKHGGRCRSQSRAEWRAWGTMLERCADTKRPQKKWYIEKGITVHPEWANDFGAFLRDVGRRPSDCHSLDRIDSTKNYEPGNVRWATWKEQARNRSNNRIVRYRGREVTLVEATELAGIRYKTVKSRLAHGWSMERALSESIDPRKVNAAHLGIRLKRNGRSHSK